MGDIVRKRGRYVYTEGRRKDLINRGGEKISCDEVENLIFGTPQVKAVALVAHARPGVRREGLRLRRPAARRPTLTLRRADRLPARAEDRLVQAARAAGDHAGVPGQPGRQDPQARTQGKALLIQLYHCVSARSFRPLWMLEELGAPYELRMLPFPPRALQRDYLALNPLGTVPLLLDGDTRMTESAAMCQYLAQRCDPATRAGSRCARTNPPTAPGSTGCTTARPRSPFRRPSCCATAASSPTSASCRRPPTTTPSGSSRACAASTPCSRSTTSCARRFTAADISVGYALMLANEIGLVPRFPPAVAAYWERLQRRDGFRRALAVQREAAVAQGVAPDSSDRHAGLGRPALTEPRCNLHNRADGLPPSALSQPGAAAAVWRSRPPACCAPPCRRRRAGAGRRRAPRSRSSPRPAGCWAGGAGRPMP